MSKYSRQILIFTVVNLTIAFLMIFVSHKTRNIEITNNKINTKIDLIKEEININEIEYSFHNNIQYLKKIHSIYSTSKVSKNINPIISLEDLNHKKTNQILLIDY
tara:strand:- start:25079 stop:25393 length:315 start_codon:yes stop_codon:yes gene_type:complete